MSSIELSFEVESVSFDTSQPSSSPEARTRKISICVEDEDLVVNQTASISSQSFGVDGDEQSISQDSYESESENESETTCNRHRFTLAELKPIQREYLQLLQ